MSVTDFSRRRVDLLEPDLDRCTLTYGVAPCTASGGAGNECYNTFRTCQDTANYNKGTHTYRFTGRGTPPPTGELVRPYIESIETAPTEIDPDKGLAVRANVRLALRDAPDNDVEQDPYIANRATPAGSTFLRRLMARNLAVAGRTARVKRLYPAPDAAYTLADAAWVTEQYIIEAITGPDTDGKVSISLKDPLKLTDRVTLPVATSGELLSGITASATSLTLKSGQGAQYGSSGFIAVGDEVIQFTGRSTDTLTWPDTSYRGKDGTVAAVQNADSRVQLCKRWSAATVATVFEELCNAAGILDANIDLAGIAAEQDLWYGDYFITACIAEPVAISKLIEELCITTQANAWWSVAEQKVKFKSLRPLSPLAAAPTVLTDASHFLDGTVEVERLEDKRLTTVVVWYAKRTPTAPDNDWKSYLRAYVAHDAEAASANEYNAVRTRVFYARFLDIASDQAAAELAVRMLNLRRDAPIEVRCELDPKDTDIDLGEQVDLETFGIVDFDGVVERQRAMLTYKKEEGPSIDARFLITFLNRRYAWIAPDTQPDYGAATDEEKRWAYISDDNGKLSDGSDGHLIV